MTIRVFRYAGPYVPFTRWMLLALNRWYTSTVPLTCVRPIFKSLMTRRSNCVTRFSNSCCGGTMGTVTEPAGLADRLRPNDGAIWALVYVAHDVSAQTVGELAVTT